MTTIANDVARMVNMLPEDEQHFAYEMVKRLVLAWDPDFTKVTPMEAERIREAEESGFISAKDIDWDNLEKYAE